VKKGKRRIRLLTAFNRLLTQSEIKSKLTLSQNDDTKLGEWIKRGLIACKTPNITKGRVYDLTDRGLKARKQLLASLDEKQRTYLLKDTHSTYSYFKPPKGMNVMKYAKIMASRKLRIPIFAILEHECRRVVDEYAGKGEDKIRRPGIKSLLKHKGIEISRSNLIDGLKEMIKIGVTEVKREGYRRNYYGLTEDGKIIMKWFLKIELLNEGCA
jgi:hypothetical protein